MMSTIAVVLIVAALLAGLALGWFFGSRPVADWRNRHGEREGECRVLNEKLSRMVPELATMSERAARADALAASLDVMREENSALKAREAGFAEKERLLEESRLNLLKEFENTGAKVLGAAQEKCLASAAERLGHSEKASKEAITALLQPVGDRLKSYEEQVAALEAKRVDSFGQ